MRKKSINIVWLKRDLRTQDHEPLLLAEQSTLPYLIVYFFEPSLIQYLKHELVQQERIRILKTHKRPVQQ